MCVSVSARARVCAGNIALHSGHCQLETGAASLLVSLLIRLLHGICELSRDLWATDVAVLDEAQVHKVTHTHARARARTHPCLAPEPHSAAHRLMREILSFSIVLVLCARAYAQFISCFPAGVLIGLSGTPPPLMGATQNRGVERRRGVQKGIHALWGKKSC